MSVLSPPACSRNEPSSRPSLFLMYECDVTSNNHALTMIHIYENLWCNVRSLFQAPPNGLRSDTTHERLNEKYVSGVRNSSSRIRALAPASTLMWKLANRCRCCGVLLTGVFDLLADTLRACKTNYRSQICRRLGGVTQLIALNDKSRSAKKKTRD